MQRSGVRQSVPQGQDRSKVKQIVDALCRQHQLRAAATVLLARATGMRLREAILADLPRLSREANDLGRINIQDGTKGGRFGASAPRWIAVDGHVRDALGLARQVSPAGSRNLIAPHESYLNVLQEIIRTARATLHVHNLKASMSYERRMHVSATNKSPSTSPLSTAANVVGYIGALTVKLGRRSATSWGTVGSMWSLPTLEDGHEQALRYGVVLGWRADRVARDAATPFTAGDAYPGGNRKALAAEHALGLASEALGLAS
ncbi:integrase domain-containing protein [Lelliottia jeotgali]